MCLQGNMHHAFFLKSSHSTEIEEVKDISLPSRLEDFRVEEDVLNTIVGEINAVEVTISRRCRKCQAWQVDFNPKGNFHRCRRCALLQKYQQYECIVKGKVSIAGNFGEEDLNLSNSVLKRYLTDEKLLHLLEDNQDVKELLLSLEKCKIKIQNSIVFWFAGENGNRYSYSSIYRGRRGAGSVQQNILKQLKIQMKVKYLQFLRIKRWLLQQLWTKMQIQWMTRLLLQCRLRKK
ncbi:hypothetical protein ROHU_018210 [Labeo rohita]|uniref:Uncharacterized protein n=1 Tax=Labeo rohita TaxID=84645 RepID=A0A498N9Y0_LABRO|nr:hypothetical protein ROHU_018210 [Labeo rohita]